MYQYDMEAAVAEFHQAFGLPLDETFHLSGEHPHKEGFSALVLLRSSLVLEEAKELQEAVEIAIDDPDTDTKAQIIKEACDVLYTIIGLMVSFDVDWGEAFRRVHDSNMSKLDEDGNPVYRKEDGKVLKSDKYVPPFLKDLT